MEPWRALAESLRAGGWRVETADQLIGEPVSAWVHLDAYRSPPDAAPPSRTVLMMFEPRVVAPYWYRRLAESVPQFATVFTHDRALVARGGPFSYLHIPHSPPKSLVPQARTEKLVMINARKYPRSRDGELYGERERVALWFANHSEGFALYGPGWSRSSLRHPLAALRTSSLRKADRGPIESKFDVLSRARFAICFENMRSPGYVSEKLFDCLACGAIPIYDGDPDIAAIVPIDSFVDYQQIGGPAALSRHIDSIDSDTETRMRQRGQGVIASDSYQPFSIASFVKLMTARLEDVAAK